MHTYTITWNTQKLKETGKSYVKLSEYLKGYGCTIIRELHSKIVVKTDKSSEGLNQELKRVFKLEFKVKEGSR